MDKKNGFNNKFTWPPRTLGMVVTPQVLVQNTIIMEITQKETE